MAVKRVSIGGGKWLSKAAAASYKRMREAGMPAGGVTSAGRTYAEQAALRKLYLSGRGNFALPAGQSVHESGNALDLAGGARAWFRARGADYGWVKDVNPAEPWHGEYRSGGDKFDHAYVVNTDKGVHLLGRAGPSRRARVKYRRARGFKVWGIKIVKGDGLRWLVTRYGTYYALDYLKG